MEVVATERQLVDFINLDKVPNSQDIRNAIEPHLVMMGDEFLKLNKTTSSLICDLNHTGITQIKNHFSGRDIVPALDDEQVDSILNFAEFLSLRALSRIAQLAQNQILESQASVRAEILKLRMFKDEHN